MHFGQLFDFIIAIAIGGLVGLEREIYQQKKRRGFAGIRTYLVVAILGAVCSYLVRQGGESVLGYIVLGGIILLLIASYTVSAWKGFLGLTTELSVILVFVLSWVSMIPDFQNIAIAFSVVLAILLSMKDLLHGFARKTKEVEWNDTLKFVFMIFVILPLIPNRDFTFLGIEEAFNPYNIWLMVIFVSGVSFVGYVLTKVVGTSQGIGLTGVLGGLASSTAVSQSMAQDSKKNKKFLDAYAFATIAATIIQFFRIVFEVWVVDFSMLSIYALPLLVMILVGIVFVSRWIEPAEEKQEGELQLGSPLALKPALLFGVYYFFVTVVSRALSTLELDSISIIMVGLVSGLADTDAITLSMASLYERGNIDGNVAWQAITAALISNIAFKAFISKVSGSKDYFKKVAKAFGVMVGLGLLVVLAQML